MAKLILPECLVYTCLHDMCLCLYSDRLAVVVAHIKNYDDRFEVSRENFYA